MTIIIDYDNDAVRIGSNYAFDNGIESKIITYKITGSMKQIQGLLCEVVNAIYDANDTDTNFSLMKQDDGEITIIEEY